MGGHIFMENVEEIQKKLIKWGKENTDEYPWRNPSSLYEILVAEIMLIRTPAEQVLPVYDTFLEKFPNERKLYNSDLGLVKELIGPLGLTWRAERLKNMSEYLMESTKIKNPDFNDLRSIPGVGSYIAAAILIYYYEVRALPIDSNTVRFMSRVYDRNFSGEARRKKELKKRMDELVPEENYKSVKFNEAFLDFMRKICTPRKPKCRECIINKFCLYEEKTVREE